MNANPKPGIESAAVTLLHTHVKSRWTNLKPRYQTAVNWAAAQAAVEVVHDMGYGATARHVESIVTEIYNELTAAGHADNTIPGKGWQVLAERLNAIAR
jgi:hypothetical protein